MVKCHCGGTIRCGQCGSYMKDNMEFRDLVQEMFSNTKDYLVAKDALFEVDCKVKNALLFLIAGREKEFLKFIRDSKVKKEG